MKRHLTDDEATELVEQLCGGLSGESSSGPPAVEQIAEFMRSLDPTVVIAPPWLEHVDGCKHCQDFVLRGILERYHVDADGRATVSNAAQYLLSRQYETNLIERAQSGDEKAWDTLVRRYNDYMIRLCQRRSNGQAEDVTQRVWLKLLRSLNNFDTKRGTRFKVYLTTVVIREQRAARQQMMRQRELAEKLSRQTHLRPRNESDERDPVEIADSQAAAVKHCAEVLGPREKEVFFLRTICGYDFEQIAEHCGIQAKSARVAYSRARKKAREELGRQKLL